MQNEKVPYAKLLQGFAAIPFNRMLGLELVSLTATEATMRFKMKEELIGNFMHGILHGGVISSVLDMAGGIVIMATAAAKHHGSNEHLADVLAKCSTIDLHVSYLRPGKGQEFIAKAWLSKSGSKISFTQMELTNEDNLLIATANGTYRL